MIVRLSSAFVPRLFDVCQEELREWAVSDYKGAHGLDLVLLFQRELVGYVELVTVSIWQEEEAMTRFFNRNQHTKWNSDNGTIEKGPRSYELIIAIGPLLPNAEGDPSPDLREGAD